MAENISLIIKQVSSFLWVPILMILLLGTGAVVKLELIWNLADIANAFMALPNLVGLLGLSGVVIALTKGYNKNLTIS